MYRFVDWSEVIVDVHVAVLSGKDASASFFLDVFRIFFGGSCISAGEAKGILPVIIVWVSFIIKSSKLTYGHPIQNFTYHFPKHPTKNCTWKKNKKKTANNKNLTQAGQILATSHVFHPKWWLSIGKSPLFHANLGWWNILPFGQIQSIQAIWLPSVPSVDIRGLKDPFTHIAAKIESEKIGPFGYMSLMELGWNTVICFGSLVVFSEVWIVLVCFGRFFLGTWT